MRTSTSPGSVYDERAGNGWWPNQPSGSASMKQLGAVVPRADCHAVRVYHRRNVVRVDLVQAEASQHVPPRRSKYRAGRIDQCRGGFCSPALIA